MIATILAPPAVKVTPFPSFPLAAVEAKLRGELVEAVKIEAAIRGMALPAAPADVARASVHVDSLVVSILCAVEPIVGFELPESVVRAGGYTSVDSAPGLPRPTTPSFGERMDEEERSEVMTELAVHQDNDDEARRVLGDRLREARKYLGLKQEEVATYLKIPRTAVTDIENGQRRVEAIELTRLAKLYRQPGGYFTGEDAAANLPIDVARLARKAADLSEQDRTELGCFAEYLRARSRAGQG